jgi:hypothetical protein
MIRLHRMQSASVAPHLRCPTLTLGFLIHGFWAGRKSSIFQVWEVPAAPKAIQEGGGRSPPSSGMVVWGRRGRPDPQNRRVPAGPKTMYEKPKCIALLNIQSSARAYFEGLALDFQATWLELHARRVNGKRCRA